MMALQVSFFIDQPPPPVTRYDWWPKIEHAKAS